MNQLCITCRNLNGCDFLKVSKRGMFDEGAVITPDNYRECPLWAPVGGRELLNRESAYAIAGMSALKGIHQIRTLILEDNPEEVNVAEDYTTMLQGYLREGMTRSEREEQLRYTTDEDGNVQLTEDGEKLIRDSFSLRKYAIDPEGPVGESPDRTMFWSTDQLITAILDAEVAAELIVDDKKSKKKKTSGAKSAKKEETMAKVSLRGGPKGKKAPGKNNVGKAAAKSKTAKPATGGKKSKVEGLDEETPAVAAGLTQEDKEEIAAMVVEQVSSELKSAVQEIMQNIDYSRERENLRLTALHDVIMKLILTPDDFSEETLLVASEETIDAYLEDMEGAESGED